MRCRLEMGGRVRRSTLFEWYVVDKVFVIGLVRFLFLFASARHDLKFL